MADESVPPEQIKKRRKRRERYLRRRDAERAKMREYAERNRDQLDVYRRQYRRENSGRRVAYAKAWNASHPEAHKATQKRYRQNHSDALRAKYERYKPRRNERKLIRKRTDPIYAITLLLRQRLETAIKSRGYKKMVRTVELVGCSIPDLKRHIEQQFLPGMSWENRSEWHIDHIRPCAVYDLSDPEQQKRCFHYTNLRPLWAMDNMRKGARIHEGEDAHADQVRNIPQATQAEAHV